MTHTTHSSDFAFLRGVQRRSKRKPWGFLGHFHPHILESLLLWETKVKAHHSRTLDTFWCMTRAGAIKRVGGDTCQTFWRNKNNKKKPEGGLGLGGRVQTYCHFSVFGPLRAKMGARDMHIWAHTYSDFSVCLFLWGPFSVFFGNVSGPGNTRPGCRATRYSEQDWRARPPEGRPSLRRARVR